MARHRDNSLKYYNRDVYDDDNLKFIQATNGLIGWAVVEKLRQKIYASPGGYFVPWNAVTERLFCSENKISLEEFKSILDNCFLDDIRLFSREMYDKHKILTSSGIQKRWLKIVTECKRKYPVITPEYSLIQPEENTPAPDTNQNYSGGNHTAPAILPNNTGVSTQTKLNETTVKEKKLTTTVPTESSFPKTVEVGTPAVAGVPATDKKVLKKNVGKKRDLPDTVDQVRTYMTEKMQGKWPSPRISANAEKLFNHYSANGWVQNKGKPIVSWKHAVNNWILNELNGAYSSNNNGTPVHRTSTPMGQSQDPPDRKLTQAERDEISRQFVEDAYRDFCSGEAFPYEGLQYYYNDLVKDGLLIISLDDKNRINRETKGDIAASKHTAVKEYFDRQRAEGVTKLYELIDAKK
jgi:hypothetical protein